MTAPSAPEAEPSADDALVARVQQGDKRAFDLLVLKYQYKVQAIISRFIKDSAEVHDVAQETFIKAYRALANFRGDSQFYTWLYRIAVNTSKTIWYRVADGRLHRTSTLKRLTFTQAPKRFAITSRLKQAWQPSS